MFQLIDPEDGPLFSNHAEIHVLELSKVVGLQPKDASKLEQWLLFLKRDKETISGRSNCGCNQHFSRRRFIVKEVFNSRKCLLGTVANL